MCTFPSDALDALLADHDTRANVDHTLAVIYALGLDPRPDVIRDQAVLYEVEPNHAELLVALIGRRLEAVA